MSSDINLDPHFIYCTDSMTYQLVPPETESVFVGRKEIGTYTFATGEIEFNNEFLITLKEQLSNLEETTS